MILCLLLRSKAIGDFQSIVNADALRIAADEHGPHVACTYKPKGYAGAATAVSMEIVAKMSKVRTPDGLGRLNVQGSTNVGQKYIVSCASSLTSVEAVAGSGVDADLRIVRLKMGDVIVVAGNLIGRPDISSVTLNVGEVQFDCGTWVGEATL